MRRIALSVILLSLASPALASECPAIWKQINDRVHASQLSEANQAKFAELRKQGEDFHHTGDHTKSIEALKQALALLG